MTPSTGAYTYFTSNLGVFTGTQKVAAGPDGHLWMTGRDDFAATGGVASVTASGAVTIRSTALSRALGLAPGADGRMWFSDSAANSLRPATIGPAFGLDAPVAIGTYARDLAADDDGNVWGVGGIGVGTAWRVGLAAPELGTPAVAAGKSTATITVPVDPNGQLTNVSVAVDGLPARTVSVPADSSAAVQTPVGFSGLAPDTEYHYAVDTTNAAGAATHVTGEFRTAQATATEEPVTEPAPTPVGSAPAPAPTSSSPAPTPPAEPRRGNRARARHPPRSWAARSARRPRRARSASRRPVRVPPLTLPTWTDPSLRAPSSTPPAGGSSW